VKDELEFYIPEDDILHSHSVKTSNLIKMVLFDFLIARIGFLSFAYITLSEYGKVIFVATRFKFYLWNSFKFVPSFTGFTMYTTCVIWLAFVPLYFGTGNHVPLRITSMSVTISLSASVTLACLFSPKLYIILIHPERNVRQSMMPVST
jgi:hypothetical protein